MLDLTVSIVVYREKVEVLSRTLASVLGSDLELEVLVLDNSPTDQLRACLPADDRIRYQHFPDNPGFGKAHNRALEQALRKARYHLVLNPDVEFDPAVLRGLMEVMDGRPGAGIVSPKIHYPDGQLQTLCKLLPTPMDVALRRLLPGSAWVERRNRIYELHEWAYTRISNIPYLSGCFLFIRTDLIDKVGGFDERFFMYFEDTDLVRRFHDVSDTLFIPDFSIIHHHNKESYRSTRLLKIHIMSAIRYFNKWGWFWDGRRSRVNRTTLAQFGAADRGRG